MRRTFFLFCLVAVISTGCSGNSGTPAVLNLETIDQSTSVPTEELIGDLSGNEIETLSSLKLVDDYPLYIMEYSGDYEHLRSTSNDANPQHLQPEEVTWACTLFAALQDQENMLYGRNFDWEYSPALLLFTDPPGGYASVSMIDIAYLGFADDKVSSLEDLPITELTDLLEAPWWPFDGMNEHGLAVGMAAVPSGNMTNDPQKPTVGSLEIIRKILDQASDVEEALDLFEDYNIDMRGGPPIHYLVADRWGQALLIEFYNGEMHVIPNEQPWHLATNFLCSAADGSLQGNCWRYDRVLRAMETSNGFLSAEEAISLLGDVAQPSTQWSVIYEMTAGRVNVVMEQEYYDVHSFQLAP